MSEQWMDWKRDVLDPLLADPPGQVDTDAPVAILSADADKVQEYVFESARLPEIRGGSMLLQGLNEEVAGLVKQAVDPDCVIYAGGGSLLAILPDDADLLAELKHKIESLYPQRTGVATTTCITYSTTAGELRDGYGTATREAVNALSCAMAMARPRARQSMPCARPTLPTGRASPPATRSMARTASHPARSRRMLLTLTEGSARWSSWQGWRCAAARTADHWLLSTRHCPTPSAAAPVGSDRRL